MTDRPLTPKQQAFVREYVGRANGNGAEAARLAGYTGNAETLAAIASENLRKPHIASAIAEHREKTIADGILTAQECAVLLSGMATGMIGEAQPEGGEAPAKHATRIAAINSLAKMRGYETPTKTEVTGALAVEVSLSPEQESALASWLLIRDDPRVRSILEESGA